MPADPSDLSDPAAFRHDWTLDEVEALLGQPFNDLLYQAHRLHRAWFDPNRVQVSTLLNIKTGACPEDCGYCAQSARHPTGLAPEPLLPLAAVVAAAAAAKAQGATRFCMGAAWRSPTDRNLDQVIAMIEAVHDLGLQTCVTLGMLTAAQARRLRDAGLDYYNHNLDSSPEFYGRVISTRTYRDRLQTLEHVRAAGLKTCTGGILGMGESRRDRASLLCQLAGLPAHPESVPINLLVQVEGTPLCGTAPLDPLEFVRTVAAARILMPASHVRLSAGRAQMTDELQALCYFAGANSVFSGAQLLTTPNAGTNRDHDLFDRLGLGVEPLAPARETPGACGHDHAAGRPHASVRPARP